jgi:hypothetical protein
MLATVVLPLLLAITQARQSPDLPLAPPPTTRDTLQPRPRPRAVEVSEWYSRRLTIHRYAAYSILPVFGTQYLAGRELWANGTEAASWAKTTHRIGATTLAGLFTVNTVTGLWNLWDSRAAPQGRALRYTHALLMLTADAGFTYAGAKLSEEAETSLDKRRLHRTIALSSMGVTIASGLMMKIWNR